MSSTGIKLFAASFGALAFVMIMIFGVIIPAPFEEGKKEDYIYCITLWNSDFRFRCL